MNGRSSPEYGQRIRDHRRRLGHTQEELAQRIGVTRPAVNRWETKGIIPTGEHITRLAEYLSTGPESQDESHTYQLVLPFDQPINLELRVSPHRADAIHFRVQLKSLAS
jgi:transcriptional regulator with XRE-family HTH domain